ncbi:MAG: DUF2064 domain-containing protein [Candidatus Hodarchaeota archaeon]
MYNNSKIGIILFTKVPLPGFVKTRLSHPQLDEEFASKLQIAMIKDTILGLKELQLNFVPILTFFPRNYYNFLEEHVIKPLIQIYPQFMNKFQIIPQEGSNIGSRFTNAFRFAFKNLDLDSVIILGSDTPHLQPSLVMQSIEILQKTRNGAVLGPSQNGGFYLLGHKKPLIQNIGSIFEESSSYGELVHAMKLLSLKSNVHILPEVTDVDTYENLITVRNFIKIASFPSTTFSETIIYYPRFTAELLKKQNETCWKDQE